MKRSIFTRLLAAFLAVALALPFETFALRGSSGGGAAGLTDAANVAITGGTITGITDLAVADGGTGASTAKTAAVNLGVPYILAKGGIPFIHLSSGSVAANGAISGITALPVAYPNAYCYFPANVLATAIAAGWYYCTFSTTTAGVAFLDTYTSGVPTIPGSPTAVTDGKGAFTGDTGERAGPSITLPANSLGVNGKIEIRFDAYGNNSAGAKTFRSRWDGLGGTAFAAVIATTQLQHQGLFRIWNAGATNKNHGSGTMAGPTTSLGGAVTLGTIDSTASTTVVLSIQKATATDNAILEGWEIQISANGL